MDEILGPEPPEHLNEPSEPEHVTFDLKRELAEMIDADNLHGEISSFHYLMRPIFEGHHVLAMGPFHSRHTFLFICILNLINTSTNRSPTTSSSLSPLCQSIVLTSSPSFSYVLHKIANRVGSHFHPPIHTHCCFHNRTTGAQTEATELSTSPLPEIAVDTPGRMLYYLQRGALESRNLGIIVLDGVDEPFDRGFGEQVVDILRLCSCSCSLGGERRAKKMQVVVHVGDMCRWREIWGLIGEFVGGGKEVVRVWDESVLRQTVVLWPWRVADWVRLGANT
ncbi:hypothetical protein P170DRAFT_468213 [Aspergillus steynii IBT 23096]|uniref:DEAD/DEAH-box helicase domain-containing protein n=1 Tax=Aspergillus steynii IBT 23096 TaxID=1392250 RepID=A0A2I2FVB3_9EURO|nr:uncharacterized protein P170DRAFT_468213 [Aspergillus steynii IBT 23096]PLB44562.1 hypothetical protein P170DRAFT_468213 [Aspergillus steynii IBT 23096]